MQNVWIRQEKDDYSWVGTVYKLERWNFRLDKTQGPQDNHANLVNLAIQIETQAEVAAAAKACLAMAH